MPLPIYSIIVVASNFLRQVPIWDYICIAHKDHPFSHRQRPQMGLVYRFFVWDRGLCMLGPSSFCHSIDEHRIGCICGVFGLVYTWLPQFAVET